MGDRREKERQTEIVGEAENKQWLNKKRDCE